MNDSFILQHTFKAPVEKVFNAWLSSREHSEMTGGQAKVSDREGDAFEAWDGYIKGRNVEIEEFSKIVQHWRTSQFEEADDDSLLELGFQNSGGNCSLTLKHSQIPEGQGPSYHQGWKDHYFNPMDDYFKGID